jgi:hypothetical protein
MTKPKSQINKAAADKPAGKAPGAEAPKAPEAEVPKAPEAEAEKAPEAKQENKPKSKYPASIVKRAQEVFGSHEVEEIFFTSDENCFTIEQYAVMHGQNLKDQDVLTVKRSEV